MENRYPGKCVECGAHVPAYAGFLERRPFGKKFVVWCMSCYTESDNSGQEDRACGDRAYEDECAQKCGF